MNWKKPTGCWIAVVIFMCTAGGVQNTAAQVTTNAADEADVQFRLGNEAYRAKHYRKAVSHYLASNRLAPNRNVMFNIARCYEQLKQYVEAYRYYSAFDSPNLKKRGRAALNKAMERVRPYVAVLNVISDPPGASIYLNRRELGSYGTTPAHLAVAPGTYRVILEKEGFAVEEKSGVKLSLGAEDGVEITLKRVVGTLQVSGEPVGAMVQVEDPAQPAVGTLPVDLEITPGDRRVLVTREGYVPRETVVKVEPGKTTSLTVRLLPQTGALVIDSEEHDALILLDGEPAGFTPTVIDNLSAGRHRIQVHQEGFQPFQTSVEIKPNQRTAIEAKLSLIEDVSAASRYVENLRRAPASVSLIPRRELDDFAYTSVAEAVRGTRGVYLSDDLTYQSLGVRGFSPFGQYGNRLLVQLDGHTTNDDWIGSSFVEHDLLSDLTQLERIEVVRGPGSALYGTGAFFGVLNLVTPREPGDEMVRAGMSALAGGIFRAYATGGARIGEEAGFWVAGGGLWGQDFDFFSPARLGSAEAPDGTARDVGGFHGGSVMGKAYWRDLTLQWYFNQRNKQIPTASFGTIFADRRAHSDDARAFVELRYEPVLTDWLQLRTRLYYDHVAYWGKFPYEDADGGLNRESYLGDWIGLELRSLFTPLENLRITVGSGYEMHFDNPGLGQSALDSEPYYDEKHPYHLVSAYLVGDYAPTDWFSFSVGGRFDGWWIAKLERTAGQEESRFIYSINPRLGLVFQPTADVTLKALFGRAFRAPSLYELTYWDGGDTQVQSLDIDPEIIYTGEIEYSHRLPQGFWLIAAVFGNYLSNLIVQEGDGDAVNPFHYTNQTDAVWTFGGEIEIRKEFRRGWMLGLQYSYQRTRVKDLIDGDEPVNSPEHMAGAKVSLPLAGRALRLASRLLFVCGRLDRNGDRTDPTLLWDLTLSGEVEAIRMRYAVGIRNLLDWRYSHPVSDEILDLSLRQPGLSLLADISFAY